MDETIDNYLNMEAEDAGSKCPPLLFVSFPSTKDPTYEQRFPGKSTCAIVTATSYKWFEQWKEEPALRRGRDYDDYKKNIGEKLWEQVSVCWDRAGAGARYAWVSGGAGSRYAWVGGGAGARYAWVGGGAVSCHLGNRW